MYNKGINKGKAQAEECKMKKSDEMMRKVFEIKCWWDDDYDERTTVYVVANSEEEADQKMKEYADNLKAEGCAELNWMPGNHIVEMDWVIV